VAAENVEILNQARENFVRKRRAMAEQMIPAGACRPALRSSLCRSAKRD
jgi:hypothetical protein